MTDKDVFIYNAVLPDVSERKLASSLMINFRSLDATLRKKRAASMATFYYDGLSRIRVISVFE